MPRLKTLNQRAKNVLAQGCTTYSKRSTSFVQGVYPTHAYVGEEAMLWAASNTKNGDWYVDWGGGLGSNIIDIQNNYTLPYYREVIAAEMIRKRIPFCEKLRFLKTGSEACQAAVRIARAYSQNQKKDYFEFGIGCGYHGWHNSFIAEEIPGTGAVYELYDKSTNIDDLIKTINEYGCKGIISYCIIEPVTQDYSAGHGKKLKELRRLCTKYRIVLIADEVVTGFRFKGYTACQYFGIEPDIICLGKAMANGYPLSVVGGKKKYMDTPGYFISSTFAGEQNAIDNAVETMEFLTLKRLEKLWNRGKQFQERFNTIFDNIKLIGYPTRACFQGDDNEIAIFMQEMCHRGHLIGKAWSILFAHTQQQIDSFMKASKSISDGIKANKYKLNGKAPQPVFKRY